MNKLKGLISTPHLRFSAAEFNRSSLIHNGMGRDCPEYVFCKSTHPEKNRRFSANILSDMTFEEVARTRTGFISFRDDFPGKRSVEAWGCNDASQLACNKAWCTCCWRSNEGGTELLFPGRVK
ncbi:hypothetical protein MKX01_001164 [Papaver californicum]|nr:hypothetical protein MKX01_001164 [Papaver californicum]